MSYSITNPLYPRPAMLQSGTGYVTTLVTTVTTGSTTVTAFNLVSPAAVDLVTFDVQVSDVRCYWEGSTPTSTSGHILPAGTAYTWAANQYNNTKFIRDASATADAVIVASPFTAG